MKMEPIALALALTVCACLSANAQFSLGGGLAYGTEVEDNGLGIQLRAMYGFAEKFRVAADYIYYLDGLEDISVYEYSINGHYIFLNQEKFAVHALAGLNVLGVRFGDAGSSFNSSEAGLNLGGGAQIKFNERLSGLAELKYNIAGDDAGQLVLSAGVLFTLGN